jgi:rhodanese-related sulfurtransferase
MPKIICLCLAFVLSACSGATTQGDANEPFKRLTPEQLHAKLEQHEPMFVFDDNGDDRYAEGHVPTAKHLKVDEVTAAALPADKTAMLVFYCSSDKCSACHHAAEAAIALGYSNVWIMPAGIKGWEEAKYPMQ